MACFRKCPTEWRFRYVLQREKVGPKSEALTKGSQIHKVLGAYHRGETPDLTPLSPDLRALVQGYRAYWGEPDMQIKLEKTDVPFKIMIDPAIMVVGEFDGIGLRIDREKKAIIEHKSSAEDISPGSNYWNKASLVDSQVTSYLLASRMLGWGHVEVTYDVLLKPRIERALATPVSARKYTKPTKADPVSRLYAGQRESDESDADYELRVLEDILKRPTHYYQRGVIVRFEHEHEAHVRDVKGTVHLMQVTRSMGENAPRNTDSCFKYGPPCDFLPVCSNGVDVMDEHFYKKKESSRSRQNVSGNAEEKTPEPVSRFVF